MSAGLCPIGGGKKKPDMTMDRQNICTAVMSSGQIHQDNILTGTSHLTAEQLDTYISVNRLEGQSLMELLDMEI